MIVDVAGNRYSPEELARRDQEAVDEIERDRLDREKAAALLRAAEEKERLLLKNNPAELARREAARRKLCRSNYLPFVMRFNPDYNAGWVHKDIARRLEKFSAQVAAKMSPRLLITVPPRHGKSTLTSKTHAPWHLGKYPTHEYMACSYSGSLSMGFSRNCRQIIRDPAYHRLFDTRLDPDVQGAEAWLTTDGGGYTSAGIGGAITGKGAHILNIDDPVKNREDAESATAREIAWNWYTSTAYTRLAPGGGVLMILTRWHDDDLAGRVIAAMKHGGDIWEIVEYPAIAETDEPYRKKGQALHPARYNEAMLAKIQKTIGPRDWSALYQQKPVPDTGGMFKKEDFVFYDYYDPTAIPAENTMVNYAAWDLAIGQEQTNDYSVGGVASIDQDEHLWVRDITRGRWDSRDLVNRILNLHERWEPQLTGIEKGMISMSIAPYLELERKARDMSTFSYTELQAGKQDKVARARAIQGMVQSRKVHIPYNAPWTEAFLNELMRFPTGVNDDQVDFFAWIGQMVLFMSPKELFMEKKPSWRDKLAQFSSGGSSHKSAMSA